MRISADIDGGRLLLNEQPVPGVLQGVSVRGKVATDEKKRPNRSGTSKQPLGWDDVTVAVRLTLVEDDLDAAIEALGALFYAMDDHGRPQIYRIQTRATRALRISQVLFEDIAIDESLDRGELIPVTMTFTQYRPIPVVSAADRVARIEASLGEFVPFDKGALATRIEDVDKVLSNPMQQLAPIQKVGLAEDSPAFPVPARQPKSVDELFPAPKAKGKQAPALGRFDAGGRIDPFSGSAAEKP
jgi:hypothetical protein